MLDQLNISDRSLLRFRTDEDNKYPGFGEVIKRAEGLHCTYWQRFALDHPNLQSFCIFELKQAHNGGFVDRPKESVNDLTINVKIGNGDTKLLD